MCGWVQVESMCGHVSISWFEQSVQLELGYISGQKDVLSVVSHVLGVLEF